MNAWANAGALRFVSKAPQPPPQKPSCIGHVRLPGEALAPPLVLGGGGGGGALDAFAPWPSGREMLMPPDGFGCGGG